MIWMIIFKEITDKSNILNLFNAWSNINVIFALCKEICLHISLNLQEFKM